MKNILAFILIFILIIPTYILGHIISVIYLYFLNSYLFGFELWYFDIINKWAKIIFTTYFQNLIRGSVCGILSFYLCSLLIKQANYKSLHLIIILIISTLVISIIVLNKFLLNIDLTSYQEIYNVVEAIILVGSFAVGGWLAINLKK